MHAQVEPSPYDSFMRHVSFLSEMTHANLCQITYLQELLEEIEEERQREALSREEQIAADDIEDKTDIVLLACKDERSCLQLQDCIFNGPQKVYVYTLYYLVMAALWLIYICKLYPLASYVIFICCQFSLKSSATAFDHSLFSLFFIYDSLIFCSSGLTVPIYNVGHAGRVGEVSVRKD